MRKLHSFLLFSLAILSFALAPSKAKASHAAGGEVIYEWISDSTYRIYFKFYRDCTGIPEPDEAPLCITNPCSIAPTTENVNMKKWTGPIPGGINNGDPVSAGCSQYKNKCDSPGSVIPGYREWWYFHLWTSPGKCNSWNFSVSISARNSSVNIAATNLYIETTFDNLHFEENSSPFFTIKPIPYVCVNQFFTYNNGAIDPDGDSLYNEMIRPLDGSCGTSTAIGWNTPPSGPPAYSIPANPLQTKNSFAIAPSSGQMTFTAYEIGPNTITVKVNEYKNKIGHPFKGLKIGHIMRDVQVQVLNCSTVAPNFPFSKITTIGGDLDTTNKVVRACINQKLEFMWWVKSSDTDAVLTVEDNHMLTIPAANITYTNVKNDSLHGHFSWTPGVADGGKTHGFIFVVKDSTCKPPGIMLYYPYAISIYVWPPVSSVPDTAVCPKETAFLTANGGGNYQWSVLPGGGPITQLSCTNCPAPVATMITPTTFVVKSTANSYCQNSTDTVFVDILPGLNFTPLKDTVTCPDNNVVLDLKTLPPPGFKYNVKWTPGLYLNDSTKSAVTVTPKAPQTYTIVLTSTGNQCKAYDTVTVDVLTGFKLENIDTAICQNNTVDVRATADSRYDINWYAESGVPGLFSNPNSITPTITPLNLGKDTYWMKVSFINDNNQKICNDDSVGFEIDYQPIPTVTVDQDQSMCFGDTLQLNGVITSAWAGPNPYPFEVNWVPGSSLNNTKIPTPIFTAGQNGDVVLVMTAQTKEAKCSASDSIKITVFPASFLKIGNDTSICPGESAQLSVTGKGVKTFRWIPDIRMSNSYSANPIVTPPSTQEYMVYGIDTNLCSDTQRVVVTVLPKATLELPDSVRLYPGQSYQFNPGGNCSYFTWYPPLGLSRANVSNPVAMPEVNTLYKVTGVTEAGCTTSGSVNVLVSAESILDLPNAFTPGSGPNGTFKVLHLGTATLKNFSIYNRWGVKVFETTNLDEGWDGSYKGEPQPLGVYIYSVEAVSTTGRKFTKQGNVTLVR